MDRAPADSDPLLGELRESAARALDELCPVGLVLADVEDPVGWDRKTWNRLSGELALPGLAIPTEYGGEGFGRIEQGVVLEELGRVLYTGPYLASAVLGAGAILVTGDSAAGQRFLPDVAAGRVLLSLGLTEVDASTDGFDFATTATAAGERDDALVVNGRKVSVIAGASADHFIVGASGTGGPVLAVVDAKAAGVEIQAEPVLDLTRRLATVTFTDARGTALTMSLSGHDTLTAVRNLAGAALASEQAGAAQGVFAGVLAYASQRIQFGREIGSFQAIRHRLADLYAGVELATAAARSAATVVDLSSDESSLAIGTAQSFCSEVLVRTAEQATQLYGGIGFTWEHPAHLFLKRAKSSELIFGDPESHRRRLYRLVFQT